MDDFDAAWDSADSADLFDAAWDAIEAPAPKVEERPLLSADYGASTPTVGGLTMSAAQGYLRGAGKAILAPADLAVWLEKKALEGLGYEPEMTYPSEAVDMLVDKLSGGYDASAAQNVPERATGTISEFVGGIPGMFGLGKALASTGVRGATAVGKALSAPVKQQIVPTVAAGAGSAYAREEFPDSAAAQILIPLASGMAPTTAKESVASLANIFSRSKNSIADLFSKTRADATARTQAKRIIEEQIDKQRAIESLKTFIAAEANVPAAVKAEKTYLPQYKRTAEITGDPGAALLEQSMRREVSELGPKIIAQDAERNAARVDLFKQAQGAEVNPQQAGGAVRGALESAEEGKKALTKALMKEADLDGPTQISTKPIKEATSKRVEEMTKVPVTKEVTTESKVLDKSGKPYSTTSTETALMPGAKEASPALLKILKKFEDLPDKTNLKAIQDHRSALGKFAGATSRDNPQVGFDAAIAKEARRALDETLEATLPPKQLDAYRAWIASRAEQGALYEGDAVGDVLSKKEYGRGYEVDDSDVIAKLIKGPEDVDRLYAALPPGPAGEAAKETLRSAKLTELFRKASKETVEGGKTQEVIMPAALSRGIKQLEKDTGKLLLPVQKRVLKIIEKDFQSQASVDSLAYRASKGQSVTSQAENVLEAIQKAVATNASSYASRVPGLSTVMNLVQDIAGTSLEARKALINKHLMRFVASPEDALVLLSSPGKMSSKRATQKLMIDLTRSLRRAQNATVSSGVRGAMNAEVGESEDMGSADDKKKDVKAVEAEIDADPYYSTLYEIESSRNPKAVPHINPATGKPVSTAKGGFQLINSTAKALGVADPFDLEQAFKGAKKLTEEHARKFKTNDPVALYSLHYLGEDVYRRWQSGKPLNKDERAQVVYLNDKVLPKFKRVYASKVELV